MPSPRSPLEPGDRPRPSARSHTEGIRDVDVEGLLGELVRDHVPAELARLVGLVARAVVHEPGLGGRVRPLLDARLRYLCHQADRQAANEPGHGRLTGSTDLAAALSDLVQACPPDPALLPAILDALPARSGGSYRTLCLVLTQQTQSYFRSAAEIDPASFLPNLAIALNNLSVRLAHVGSYGRAASAAAEAVDKLRRLADADRESFAPDLTIALRNQSLWLTNLGRWDEALAATGEVVGHYRALAARDPVACLPRLAASLRDLSVQMAASGRREQARSAATEAVMHFRELADADPGSYRSDLADSLQNLAQRLLDLGLRKDAAARRAEAESLLRPDDRRGSVGRRSRWRST